MSRGYLVDDEVRVWTLRRRASLGYHQAEKLLPSIDAMILDWHPYGDRRTVPAPERAAVLASVKEDWDARYGADVAPGDLTCEGYEFEDHDGRLMLYLRQSCC